MCSAWPLWCSNLPHAALFRYWLFLYRDDCHAGHKPPWEQVLFVRKLTMKLQGGKLRRRTLYGTRTWSSDLDLGHWRPILDTGPWAGTWEPGPGKAKKGLIWHGFQWQIKDDDRSCLLRLKSRVFKCFASTVKAGTQTLLKLCGYG